MSFENFINSQNSNRRSSFYGNRHHHYPQSKLQLLFKILGMALTNRKLRWFILAIVVVGIGLLALVVAFIFPYLFDRGREFLGSDQVRSFLDSIIN